MNKNDVSEVMKLQTFIIINNTNVLFTGSKYRASDNASASYLVFHFLNQWFSSLRLLFYSPFPRSTAL